MAKRKQHKKPLFKDGKDIKCKERQKELNQLFKYKLKPRCLTELEYKEWAKFRKVRTLTISNEQIKYICKLYSDVMNRQYFEPRINTSKKPIIHMIDKLDIVFNSYN